MILRFLDLLGITWGGYQFFTVINNVKEALLVLMFMLYAGVRLYFEIRFKQNRDRKERFEQCQREQLAEKNNHS